MAVDLPHQNHKKGKVFPWISDSMISQATSCTTHLLAKSLIQVEEGKRRGPPRPGLSHDPRKAWPDLRREGGLGRPYEALKGLISKAFIRPLRALKGPEGPYKALRGLIRPL